MNASKIRRPVAVMMGGAEKIDLVFGRKRLQWIAQHTRLKPKIVIPDDWPKWSDQMQDIEIIFSTWMLPNFTEEDVMKMPKLRAVFYAAGDVSNFALPLLKRGVQVFSAAAANAIPVAEFTLAQILLSNKNYFANTKRNPTSSVSAKDPRCFGNLGATVALLGAGEIGRLVIKMLKSFQLKVLVFDPFLSQSEATRLKVQKVTLAQAFARGHVVSNHLANVPATRGLLRGAHFSSMRPGATFINTGRGATVCETELIQVLRSRKDITALLDVTDPEPPPKGSPFYSLPNVWLSPHIAGSLGHECGRMADLMLEEFKAWSAGCTTRCSVPLSRFQSNGRRAR
jgi:phosphoglycerate dehydrogenase-like enzyme